MSTLALILAEAEHELAPLIAPPLVIAGCMALFFTVAGLVTFSYRDVSNRHAGASRGASQSQDDAH